MNERIKELELQAADGTVDPNGPFTAEEFNNFTKKFAELIVQNCLDQCYSRGMNDALYSGQLQAASYIEEYFGFEI